MNNMKNLVSSMEYINTERTATLGEIVETFNNTIKDINESLAKMNDINVQVWDYDDAHGETVDGITVQFRTAINHEGIEGIAIDYQR